MKGIGLFAIILDSHKRILLNHRRDYDIWDLPGGGIEPGESPWDGVVREVKEETGLKVKVEKLIGVYYKTKKDEMVMLFLCKKIKGKIIPTNESQGSKFYQLQELPENTVPNHMRRIKLFFQEPNKLQLKNDQSFSTRDLIKKLGLKKQK